MKITSDDDFISYDDVQQRLAELEDEGGVKYVVQRIKNGFVLGTFDDEDEAARFVDDEDYAPDRVEVVEQVDEEVEDELRWLRDFNNEASQDIDGWDRGASITLVRASYVDGYFARDRAADTHAVDFGEWPFDCIDWDDAASGLLDRAGTAYARLDGVRYYAV